MEIQIKSWNGENWILNKFNFDTENDFSINEQNLDRELCRMAQLLLHYGVAATELRAQHARCKEELDSLYAIKALKIRSSGTKITENNIKELIHSDLEYRELLKETLKSEALFNKLENLYKSLLRKSDCLIALSYKQRKEISSY